MLDRECFMHRLEQELNSYKDPFIQQGIKAAKEGKALTANPYQSLSSEYEAWRAGWFLHVNTEQQDRETVYA